MTDLEKKEAMRRKRVKQILDAQAATLAGLEKSQTEMKAQIDELRKVSKSVEELASAVKSIDTKSIMLEVERLKAGHNATIRNIQRSSAYAIPGAEDLAPKFSLLKAIISAKTNGQKFGDTVEFELMKQARAKASQVMGVDGDGGWFVPDQVIPDVIASIYRKSVLLDLAGDGQTRVSVIDGLSGAKVRIPKFKKGVIAYWQGEFDDATLSKVGTGEISMTPRKINALTRLTEEQQRFAAYGFETMLRNDMVRALAEKVDYTILYGSGQGDQPEGVTKLGINTYTAGSSATAHAKLDYAGLSNMDLLIEEADLQEDSTFATISSPAYFRYLANLRVLNYSGQAEEDASFLAGLPPITRARLAEIIGSFDKTTGIASNKNVGDGQAKATDVFRGNWGEVLVGRWSGIEVVTENGYDIVNDSRLVKMRMYMDVGSRYPKAISWCANAKARA